MAIEIARDGRLLRLTLNRPEKRNALDLETCREMVASLREASADSAIGAILLSAHGKAFCAGMDLTEAADADPRELADAHYQLFTFGEWVTKPVIAAVQGPALAGGTGLVANAHVVIASPNAFFGLTEVRIGLWPVLIFPAIIAAMGERRAVELALTGRTFDAHHAAEYELVTEVIAPEALADRATAVASALADASSSAITAGLAYVRQIRGQLSENALNTGRLVRDQMMRHPDFAEGVQAFQEKRAPVWPSHRT